MSPRFRLDGYVTPPPIAHTERADAPAAGPGFILPMPLQLQLVWVRLEPPALDLDALLAVVREVTRDDTP
jgi:hypothetical protein